MGGALPEGFAAGLGSGFEEYDDADDDDEDEDDEEEEEEEEELLLLLLLLGADEAVLGALK